MNIWTLGDAVVDLLPLSHMQYQACAGGAPFNVAVGTARLGCQSGFIGRVGDDDFGHFLKDTLSTSGVSVQSLQMYPRHRTSTVLVSLNNSGEREFTFLTNPSADQFLTPDALPDLSEGILHFCSLALLAEACRNTLATAIRKIKQSGGLLSFDVNLREQMWDDKKKMRDAIYHFSRQADILKLSEEEWYWLADTRDFGRALNFIKALPASLKVVTYGAQGAMVLCDDKVIHFNGYTVDSVDTTGAGDAFLTGLLAYIARAGMPHNLDQIKEAMTHASACGALATTQKGALTALPDNQMLNEFISQYSLPDYEIKVSVD